MVQRPMMAHQSSFNGVLNNVEDQVVVRDLLIQFVPEDTKRKIIEEFNNYVDRRNARVQSRR